jgi:hypothetical protein
VLTLIVFLIFRIPKIWQGVDYTGSGPDDETGPAAAAITLLVTGTLTLTVQYWAGPTHTWGGTNWAATFEITRILFGLSQMLGSVALLVLQERVKTAFSKNVVQN